MDNTKFAASIGASVEHALRIGDLIADTGIPPKWMLPRISFAVFAYVGAGGPFWAAS